LGGNKYSLIFSWSGMERRGSNGILSRAGVKEGIGIDGLMRRVLG